MRLTPLHLFRTALVTSVRTVCLCAIAATVMTSAEAGDRWSQPYHEDIRFEAPVGGASPSERQQPDVVLPCNWSEALTFTYDYTRKRTDKRNPQLKKAKSGGTVTVTVTDSGNPSRFTYDVTEPYIKGPSRAVDAFNELMQGLDTVPKLQLVMTDGNLTSVENFTDVIDKMWAVIRQNLEQAGSPPQAIQQTEAVLRSPQTGMALLLKEPGQFFAMHCIGLNRGQTLEMAVTYPNPLGGPPIPGNSRITLTKHKPQSGEITLTTVDQTAPGALNRILDSVIAQLASSGLSDDQLAERMAAITSQMPPIERTVTGNMVYSTVDGFPIAIKITEEVGAKGHARRRVDTRTWTRTD